MYERSAIVLEKYFNSLFGFENKINLKNIYRDYKDLIEEIEEHESVLEQEDEIISEFDDVANEIRKIQQEQKKLYKLNLKIEQDREQLFSSLDETPENIEKKLKKIEEINNNNNIRLEELRKEFVDSLTRFGDKQKERNICSRNRRTEENKYMQIIERSKKNIEQIELSLLKKLKDFKNSDAKSEIEGIIDVMLNNGKDERVPFDENVIEHAVKIKTDITKKEAECYIIIYERMRKILAEINSEDMKLDKYKKALRDVSVKFAFLKAQKMYIISFLDNERMTAMSGPEIHQKLMNDACEKFELDMEQFDNLYELIVKETAGKATKKAYKDLYNKEYLKNIKEKERNFEKEVDGIKIHAGTIINSNYWRIDEIKNIYEVFLKEVSEKFEKDLSEFKLEEVEENTEYIDDELHIDDEIFEKKLDNRDSDEYEFEYDDDYYESDEREDENVKMEEQEEYDDSDDESIKNEEKNEYENDDDEYEYEYEYDDEYEDDNEVEYEDENDDEDENGDEDEEYEYEDDDEEYEDEEDDEEYEYEYEDDEDDEEFEYEFEEDDDEDDKEESIHIKQENKNDVHNNKEKKKGAKRMSDKKSKGLFNKFFKD